jgi:hypothetical protein
LSGIGRRRDRPRTVPADFIDRLVLGSTVDVTYIEDPMQTD